MSFESDEGQPESECHTKTLPDPPRESSCNDDPVRMRFGVRASPGQSLGDAIQVVAPIEAISEAYKIALGMFGANMMIGAGDRRLDVAEHCVDPFERRPLRCFSA